MDRARGVMETAAEKIKIVKPGDSVMVPVPDLDTVQCTVDGGKIDAHSLHAVIVEEYSNGQFKMGQGTF